MKNKKIKLVKSHFLLVLLKARTQDRAKRCWEAEVYWVTQNISL